jgi:nucleoside-diphosphate-sugar epimerase
MKKNVLITGGGGHIATRLALRYLQESDACVMLWLHANSVEEFEQKRVALDELLGPEPGRVEYYPGNLAAEKPFADIDPARVNVVVHAAAVTRFNVEETLAKSVNVEGSEKLYRFCERCPNLERLALLSTVYASGLRTGVVEEAALDDCGFANHYESSKWAAENLLLTRYAALPWQILRVSTIIAEDDDGVVGQYNAVHNTLKLLFYGLLPIIPGKPDTPLYFVTSRFVASSIFSLLCNAADKAIFHISHSCAEVLSLGELIDLSFRAFGRDADFRKRRVMPPLYSDQTSFERLADSVQGFGGAVMKQSVASVTPFSKQLFLPKDIRNDRLVSQIGPYRPQDQRQLVEKICANLLMTRWGRDPMAAPSRIASAV